MATQVLQQDDARWINNDPCDSLLSKPLYQRLQSTSCLSLEVGEGHVEPIIHSSFVFIPLPLHTYTDTALELWFSVAHRVKPYFSWVRPLLYKWIYFFICVWSRQAFFFVLLNYKEYKSKTTYVITECIIIRKIISMNDNMYGTHYQMFSSFAYIKSTLNGKVPLHV